MLPQIVTTGTKGPFSNSIQSDMKLQESPSGRAFHRQPGNPLPADLQYLLYILRMVNCIGSYMRQWLLPLAPWPGHLYSFSLGGGVLDSTYLIRGPFVKIVVIEVGAICLHLRLLGGSWDPEQSKTSKTSHHSLQLSKPKRTHQRQIWLLKETVHFPIFCLQGANGNLRAANPKP